MQKRWMYMLIWGFIAALFFFPLSSIQAQSGDEPLFFPETGFNISGPIRDFYQAAPQPEELFGYPISGEIVCEDNGLICQYFQNVRLEVIERFGTQSVQISDLGEFFYEPGVQEIQVPENIEACKKFEETDREICYGFLQFYEANAGSTFFGLPISNMESRDGRKVQYFEKVRMEWRPENPSGERMVLTDLGQQYYDQYVLRLENDVAPVNQFNETMEIVDIRVMAFVHNSLIKPGDMQLIDVIVTDQLWNPIEGASILITTNFPGKGPSESRPELTNEHGISTLEMRINEILPREIVEIDVEVKYLGFQKSTRTWFRGWW